MLKPLLFALMSTALQAAVIRGTVVEKQTGKPLARALIVVQPVTGSKGATTSVRSNPNGVFEVRGLPPGMYLVSATKTGFFKAEYGQKRWFSAGTPVSLAESGEFSMRLALPHFGAITGRALDENNIGIPNCTVMAYRNSRPPELIEKALTDDRGAYRIPGLRPGSYLVRTASLENDVGVYLPTFARESATVGGGLTTDTVLDQDSFGADVRPTTGRLVTLSGYVSSAGGRTAAIVTLTSDMGSQRFTAARDGRFEFTRLAPGTYELTAADQSQMAYQQIELDRDRQNLLLALAPMPSVHFVFRDTAGKGVDCTSLPFLLRRRELSGPGKLEYLRLDDGQMQIAPGHWEVSLGPTDAWYVAKLSGPDSRPVADNANWSEILVTPGSGPLTVDFRLSPAPAALHGVVTEGGKPAAGAPVYLESYNPNSGRRAQELRATRADVNGKYVFVGLAPGNYRVLSTFEYQAPETSQMSAGHAAELKIEEGAQVALDLALWVLN